MKFALHDIDPELGSYIKSVSSIYCDDEADTRPFRVFPDGCVELFMCYTGEPLALVTEKNKSGLLKSFVSCRVSGYTDVSMQLYSGFVSVCFHPGMGHYFFNRPMSDLAGNSLALEDVWADDASIIETEMAGIRTNEERAAYIQKVLLSKLVSHRAGDEELIGLLAKMLQAEEAVSVARLADQAGISQRQLARKFNKQLGLAPKEFSRLKRFVASLDFIRHHPGNNLTTVALENGYYDQAHFIRDFREFAGIRPGELEGPEKKVY
jgi:AraC-like DNA-binding protein